MCYGHFFKLFVEAIFVERLAGRTVPINTTAWRALFYWVGFGGLVGFSLYHPELIDELTGPTSVISKYIPASIFPADLSDIDDSLKEASFGGQVKYQVLVLVFILAEFMNLQCHLHYTTKGKVQSLSMLKSIGREESDPTARTRTSNLVASITKSAVLRDHGYSYVTAADYLWEFVAWLAFALVVDTMVCYGFVGVWFIWHACRARGRNNRFANDYRG